MYIHQLINGIDRSHGTCACFFFNLSLAYSSNLILAYSEGFWVLTARFIPNILGIIESAIKNLGIPNTKGMNNTTVMANQNTPVRNSRLEELEKIIEEGLKSFISVGNALFEIKQDKLYKQLGYKTFEEYCISRWNILRNYANKQIAASNVVNNLIQGTIVPKILPANEAQARHLTKLSPDSQRKAWTIVLETAPEGKITEKHVKKVVGEMLAEQYSESVVENSEELPALENGDLVQIHLTNKSDPQLNRYDRSLGIVERITELGLIVVKVWQFELPPLKREELHCPTASTKITIELPTKTISTLMKAGYSSVNEALLDLRELKENK